MNRRGEEPPPGDETCWTLVRAAARDDRVSRSKFVERYIPVIRAYLHSRWRSTPYFEDLEDAVQEIFLQCFQPDGALGRVDPAKGTFRGFLYGVVRRAAQAFETKIARRLNRQNPGTFHPEIMPADELSLSIVFDRAWAMSVIKEAGDLHRARAEELGGDHLERVEVLRLRFQEGKPIREIAELVGEEAKRVHWAYARAREEFKSALCDVLEKRGHAREDLEAECQHVFSLLS